MTDGPTHRLVLVSGPIAAGKSATAAAVGAMHDRFHAGAAGLGEDLRLDTGAAGLEEVVEQVVARVRRAA